jgi:DNA-binding transcriptional ArsR family regulator
MKATSHPTRELILRELKEGTRSTVELEEVTGESRYNLYHHLSVLEDAQLVTSGISEGRAKVFELSNPKRPEVAFIVLDGQDDEEAKVLKKVVELLRTESPGGLPHSTDIHRAKMMFYYPWSSEE